tara:strand:+ start:224 stop:832 length:609 start_codon:yes stop_codon:yes gene_type:complete
MITTEAAISIFKQHGGILRTKDAISLGINPKTLYSMRDKGYIDSLNRGIFRLVDSTADATYIDLIIVSKRLPKGVICLISALSFHGLTTEIPRSVCVGFRQGWRQPKIEYPPVKIFRYSTTSFDSGIEYHTLNGLSVPVYSAAKTVVDCFKFRNRVGKDVALEALKEYLHQYKGASLDELYNYARICRVEGIITPYLEMSSL